MNTQADYLKALGVDIWLPRAPLQHAAQSPEWVYRFVHPSSLASDVADEFVAGSVPSASTPVSVPRTADAKSQSGASLALQHAEQRSIAHISEALGESLGQTVRRAPTGIVSDSSEDQAGDEGRSQVIHQTAVTKTAPRFRLAVTRTPRFLLVDELPMQGTQILGDRYKRLLAGVVTALGEDPQSMSLSVVLQWPQLAGSKLNQDAVEAFKYVQRTLSSMQRQTSAEHLLMFGPNVSRWVLGEDHTVPRSGELFIHPQQNISCLATSMLSQALQLPDIKRQIWYDLQPVVRG